MIEYLIWQLCFLILPLAFLWVAFHKILKKHLKIFKIVVVGSLIFGIPWDYLAIQQKIWLFSSQKILNVWVLQVPFEEWMFIVFFGLLISTFTVLLKEKTND